MKIHNNDDDEPVRDGEFIRVPLNFMDTMLTDEQHATMNAIMQDAAIGQRLGQISDEDRDRREQAIADYDLRVSMSWKNPPVLTEEDDTTTTKAAKKVHGRHATPDAAYQQYDQAISERWREGGAA